VLDPENVLVRAGVFGRQVEQFFETDIGDYILQRAQKEIDEAVFKLKKVNPRDAELIQTYQNDIRVCESIISWLADAIAQGQAAVETLKGEEDAT
jgi:hypothetical protein